MPIISFLAMGHTLCIMPSFSGLYTVYKHVIHAGEKAIASTCKPHCTQKFSIHRRDGV